jgi:hypothetical protein
MSTTFTLRFFAFAASSALFACGSAAQMFDAGTEGDDAGGDVSVPHDSGFQFGDAQTNDAGAVDASCDPPEMLVVLDRSDSMKQPPSGADGGASKWELAEDAVELITAPPIDSTLRYGLELLPDKALSQGDGGTCGSGLLSIPSDLGNGPAIASTLQSTSLENGTPIGGALGLAQSTLKKDRVTGRAQYVVLVTDGNETCKATPALPIVQDLATSGVLTYVVGFGGKADPALLNDLACAGMTATNFSTSCEKSGNGYIASVPDTTHVFFDAADGPALQKELASIAGGLCCGCVITPN